MTYTMALPETKNADTIVSLLLQAPTSTATRLLRRGGRRRLEFESVGKMAMALDGLKLLGFKVGHFERALWHAHR